MNNTRIWAILVATQHGQAGVVSAERRLKETRQLIERARAVAGASTTCALVAPRFLSEWNTLAADLPPHNLFIQGADLPALTGISRVLRAIRARDRDATVVLIPADHCAEVESAWVLSARGALARARDQLNTVYLLHDQTAPEKRAFDAAQDFCSSTVIVGSALSLLDLCEGKKNTKVLDLMTENPADSTLDGAGPSHESAHDSGEPAINLVHVRLVEEYARIQSGHYAAAPSAHVHLTA
jgi:hypothetical protein